MTTKLLTASEFEAAVLAKKAVLGFSDFYGTDLNWINRYDSEGKYVGCDRPEFASESDLARLTITYTEAVRALRPVTKPVYCRGGSVQVMSDIWETCSGCFGCRASLGPEVISVGYNNIPSVAAGAAWSIGTFVWRAANLETHAALEKNLAGFRALSTIGTIFVKLAEMANKVSGLFHSLKEGFNEVAVGRCFEVTGKRGKAKAAFGLVGICKWVGVSGGRTYDNFGRGRAYTVGGTDSVGLLVPGNDKLVYVSVKSVTRVLDTEEAKEAKAAKEEKAARKSLVASKGEKAFVVAGKDAGKNGTIFWVGTTNDGRPRYGIDTNPDRPTKYKKGYRAPEGFTVWADGTDCLPYAFGSEEHIDAEVKELSK